MGKIENIENTVFPQYLFWLKQCELEDSMWTKVTTLEQYQNVVNPLLGDPQEGFEWDLYHIQGCGHRIAWVVDAAEILIQQPTPETLIAAVTQAFCQMHLAIYLDRVNDWEMLDVTFNEYYKKPLIELNNRLALFSLQLEREQDADLLYYCVNHL